MKEGGWKRGRDEVREQRKEEVGEREGGGWEEKG